MSETLKTYDSMLSRIRKLEQQNKHYRDIIQDFIDHADDYNISRVEKYHLCKALESESDGS